MVDLYVPLYFGNAITVLGTGWPGVLLTCPVERSGLAWRTPYTTPSTRCSAAERTDASGMRVDDHC